MASRGLGKGLDALIPAGGSSESSNTKQAETIVKITKVEPNREQPRKNFDEDALQELADSIKQFGLLQPILVQDRKDYYEIIAGERRWRAAKLAGLKEVPVIIRNYTNQEIVEISLIENIQREDLNPIEEAEAFEKIIKTTNITQEEAAKKFGKSRSYITNILGLLTLPEKTKKLVTEQKISMGHARALSKLEDPDKINELANMIIEDGLSVRDLEKMLSNPDIEKKVKTKKVTTYNPRFTIYESIMRERVGTKVKINNKKIEIPYDSENDLDRILEILGISVEGE